MANRASRRNGMAWAALACAAILVWLLLRLGAQNAPPRHVDGGTRTTVALPPSAQEPAAVAAPAEVPSPVEESPSPADAPEEAPDPAAVPLEVVLRNGVTGEPVPGCTVVILGKDGKRRPLRAEGTRHILADSPFRRGEEVGFAIEARLPAGFVEVGPHSLFLGGATVSPGAQAVAGNLIVWPEARVRLHVEEEDGKPVGGAVPTEYAGIAQYVVPGPEPTDPRGDVDLRGVPAIRGERIGVSARRLDRGGTCEPVIIGEPTEEVLLRVVLPGAPPREDGFDLPVGQHGAHGLDFGEWGGDRTPPATAAPRRSPPATGSLIVRVRRRDGNPAEGVFVATGGTFGTTDAEGIARFPSLAPARHAVRAGGVGFHVDEATAQIEAGVEAVLELRESHLVDAEVTVLDAEGRVAPGVHLSVFFGAGGSYCVMDGDTQTVGLFTGPFGRRRLPGIPSGKVWISAHLGTRDAQVMIEGGGTVEIRLPPAK